MNGLLIAFEITLLIPLFLATWRTSLLGLSLQGAFMSWIAFRHGIHFSVESVLEVVDLVVIRAIAAPVVLYVVLKRQKAPRRNDVIPPNLLSWTIALALVVLSFRVGDALVPQEGDSQTLVSVATSALLLGLLVLSTRSGPFSQMVAVLRIENAIALFELGSEGEHHQPIGVRIGQIVVLAISVGFYRWYLVHLGARGPAPVADPKAAL